MVQRLKLSFTGTRKKIKVMFFGVLLLIVLLFIVFLLMPIHIFGTTPMLLAEAIALFLGSIWVGWRLKTFSWQDAIGFGIICVLFMHIIPFYYISKSFGVNIPKSLVIFGSVLIGVTVGGKLYRKLTKK